MKCPLPIRGLLAAREEIVYLVAPILVASASSEEAATLAALIEQDPESDGLAALTRRYLERMSGTAERTLLLAASFFDRPPAWAALRDFLTARPPLHGLTEGWHELSEEAWEEVIQRLAGQHLLQRDAEAAMVFHPRLIECLAGEMRQAFPETWGQGQRWLRDYFAAQPATHQPDTVLEMEPLFRAVWHGCQAREYQKTFSEIGLPRIARGANGYLAQLGEYQAALNLLGAVTPDFRTFPADCDLDAEMRALIINYGSWVFGYLGRLPESRAAGEEAWKRLTATTSVGVVLVIASHLLHLQMIHGDLQNSPPVLKRLWTSLRRNSTSAEALMVPPEFLSVAFGRIGVASAAAYWYRGHRLRPELILRVMLQQCSRIMGARQRLANSHVAQWHAMLLLDMRKWDEVATLLDSPGLHEEAWMVPESGSLHLIRGRTFAAQAAAAKVSSRAHLLDRAHEELSSAIATAEANEILWWQCAAHLALARRHLLAGEKDAAQRAGARCAGLAKQHQFKLLEIDAELLLCRVAGEPPADALLLQIEAAEYGRATH